MGARLDLGILKPNPAACGGLGLTVHEQSLPSKIPVSLLWPLSLPVLYPGPSPIPTPTSPAAQLLDRLSISGLWLYSFYTPPLARHQPCPGYFSYRLPLSSLRSDSWLRTTEPQPSHVSGPARLPGTAPRGCPLGPPRSRTYSVSTECVQGPELVLRTSFMSLHTSSPFDREVHWAQIQKVTLQP